MTPACGFALGSAKPQAATELAHHPGPAHQHPGDLGHLGRVGGDVDERGPERGSDLCHRSRSVVDAWCRGRALVGEELELEVERQVGGGQLAEELADWCRQTSGVPRPARCR